MTQGIVLTLSDKFCDCFEFVALQKSFFLLHELCEGVKKGDNSWKGDKCHLKVSDISCFIKTM